MVLLLMVTGAGLSTAATNITYYMNQAIGVGNVTGSIVTDGKLGVLGPADLVDWNLVLNDGATTFDLLGPLSGSNSMFFPAAVTGLSATPTQLLFDFNNGTLGIAYLNLDYRVCFSSVTCASAPGSGEWLLIVTFNGTINPNIQFTSLSGTQVIATTAAPPAFFTGQLSVGSGVYYLQLSDANVFGYYSLLSNSILYHYDMGYEAFIPGSASDIFMYDFASGHWFYTGAALFPYLYDFTLNTWIYYFSNPQNPGHYTANPRYFSNLATAQIFTM
jgi:hypothetical protein